MARLRGEPQTQETALQFYRSLVTLLTLHAGGAIHIDAKAWSALQQKMQVTIHMNDDQSTDLVVLMTIPELN